MYKRLLLVSAFVILMLITLWGCEPIYPLGNIKAEKIPTLSPGESIEVVIVYPDTGYFSIVEVIGWKDQNLEIIQGDDIVSVSGLSITGLKAGTAVLKISVTTIISEQDISSGYDEKVYSTRVRVKVKGE